MKKIILFLMAALFYVAINAQSVSDAESMLKYNRYTSAETTLLNIINSQPANMEAWYLLSQVYASQQKATAGIEALSKATQVANMPLYKAAMGHMLLQEGKVAEAQQYFDAALKETKKKDVSVLAAVANAHIQEKQGDLNYAVDLLNTAIKRDKRNAGLKKRLGDAYYRLNDGSQSYTAYQDAIKLDGNNAEAMYSIGKIFKTQNNADMYLQYFQNAIAADPQFAPAYFELYYHYYYNDLNKAKDYLEKYISTSDPHIDNDYLLADILYLTEQYERSNQVALNIIKSGQEPKPRIYKLMGYNYQALKQPTLALENMQLYFTNEADSNILVKDLDIMATLYNELNKPDSVAHFYAKAVSLETDSAKRYPYYKKLADLHKEAKNYTEQAKWMELFYTGNTAATNVDLFTWGLAEYMAKNYKAADSVFGIYTVKYPEQGFGFYWRARSNAALDAEMKDGLAVPYYEKLTEIAEKDIADANNKKWLVEAYGYIAAYTANEKKDYNSAIDYFEKLLEVDPENADAKKYIDVLENSLEKSDK